MTDKMRFIELWDPENLYDYHVNVDHIVWLKQVELGGIGEQEIERTIVKLSNGQEITASQTIAEIYNAL